ncbi:MAG: cyclase family protein [Defluviitaleaceae bacterium]|nr:cyclase family protein [Defluviitaleaceae bacterium]
MKIYDITASISNDLPVYGDEKPAITHLAQMGKGDAYNVSRISATTHTGTHADMPLHFIPGGDDCTSIDLSHFYGPAKVMKVNVKEHVNKDDIEALDIQAGDIILLNTGQSKYMSQGSLKQDFLGLTVEAAEYLAQKKIKTVGIDYLSVDPYGTTGFPVHKTLLGNGITVLEGLVLEHVPEGAYTLSALPLKIPNGDGSPVRAVLVAE